MGRRVSRHLAFTLYAPYGAFGLDSQSAPNQARKATWLEPSKSALIGLLGAALGAGRADLGALAARLRVAVRIGLAPAREASADYHTVTPAAPPAGRRRWARYEELKAHFAGDETRGSILSWREYWSHGLWITAIAAPQDQALLDRLFAALVTPHWTLYAGRKACALGLPPDPALIDAESPQAALEAYGWPWTRHSALKAALDLVAGAVSVGPRALIFDLDYPGAPRENDDGVSVVTRRDRPVPIPVGQRQRVRPYHAERRVGRWFPEQTETGATE